MLILEGPDFAGKTTLAHALLKRLHDEGGNRKFGPYPAVYEHFSALPPAWHYPKSYFPHIKRYSIMDRFHVSELCYGPITRGTSNLDSRAVMVIDAMLTLVGGLTVVITLDDAFLVKQWEANARNEMFNLEQVRAVNAAYAKLPETHPELRIDLMYLVDSVDGYVSNSASAVDQILQAWSSRQAFIQSLTGVFYEPSSREVDKIRAVL